MSSRARDRRCCSCTASVTRQAARAHLQIPKARMIPLYGCGHVPMNDDPDLVARTILNGSGEGL